MNQFEFVLAIVAIVMIASVLKARYGHLRRHRGQEATQQTVVEAAENRRLKEEVTALRDRIAVLERITVEKESSLEREIEKLRDR
ncbi:MAG TPA: hypothetical protein VHM92_07405 [Allosphingosinicella sp.]|nr:hypothetical protein [Allosphingosinicella sp.]